MIYEIIDTRTGERAKAYELVQEPWAEKVRGCGWPALAIDEDGDVMLTDDCGNYDMVPEGRVEVRLVIDREGWKPCEKCNKCISCVHVLDSIEDVSSACYECEDYGNHEPQNYCPQCGRPLTNAAWAELEKKIRGCVE